MFGRSTPVQTSITRLRCKDRSSGEDRPWALSKVTRITSHTFLIGLSNQWKRDKPAAENSEQKPRLIIVTADLRRSFCRIDAMNFVYKKRRNLTEPSIPAKRAFPFGGFQINNCTPQSRLFVSKT